MKKGLWKRIAPYLKPYARCAVISVLCAAVSSAVQLMIPVLCGKAIDCMIAAGKVNFDGVYAYAAQIAALSLLAAAAQQQEPKRREKKREKDNKA